jgi:Holliday junction DNA helicase RuvA
VGKKTAERIAMELGDKLTELAALAADGDGAEVFVPTSTADTDAVDALLALGYKKPEAQRAVKTFKTQNTDAELEEIIRGSLAILSG